MDQKIDFAEELIKLNEARKAYQELVCAADSPDNHYLEDYCSDVWKAVARRFDREIGPAALGYLYYPEEQSELENQTKLIEEK